MAQEKAVLLATTHGEADEVAQRVFILEGELVAMRWAQHVIEEKLLGLAARVATTNPQWEAIEEQYERLVHELTLLSCVWP
jgi:hypothetical protein